ncbi:MAG: hypothetical protein IPH18_10060 [Chitinophagaceae bacterium]|nr:hypothetical protein [Chitinophagaceae bacterium]
MSNRLVTFAEPVYMKVKVKYLLLTAFCGLLMLNMTAQTLSQKTAAKDGCVPEFGRSLFS